MPETDAANRQVRPQTVQKENKTRIQRPVLYKVLLLSGEEYEVPIDKRAVGQMLFENVCEHLELLERDYFGLLFRKNGKTGNVTYWLDPIKKITDQVKGGRKNLEFAVKFYPPDPTQVFDGVTRYLLCQQIRRDIISGRLQCSEAILAMLGSYTVQAEIGDYDPLDHGTGIHYIQDMPFAPDQTEDLLYEIAALHKEHKGQTPEQAELHYLEYSKKLPLYGIDLHRAKDVNYMDIFLGIGASGISVYRDNIRINRFVWPKILKISYRRNKFLLKIRPAEFETFESCLTFRLPNNRMAKRLWKIAMETHAFLRLRSAEDARPGSALSAFGSKHRFSGRTLYQTRLYASVADRPTKRLEKTYSQQSLTSVSNNKLKNLENVTKKSENVYEDMLKVPKDSPKGKERPVSQQTFGGITPALDQSWNRQGTDSESFRSSRASMESVDSEEESKIRVRPEAALNPGKPKPSTALKKDEKLFESEIHANIDKLPSPETSFVKLSNRKPSKKNKENEKQVVREVFM